MPETTDAKPRQVLLAGSNLEAETLYKSPYFPESYYFPYNPDPLARGNNYEIYDEMRDDDQVKVAITVKKDMVVNSGWRIECESEEIAKEITDALREMEESGRLDMAFEDILRAMVSSAYELGFSMSEPVYRLDGGKYSYDTVKVRPPHSFRFIIDERGNIIEICQSTNRGDLKFQPEKFIHFAYQSDFGNPYGKSDLRSAYGPWKAKKFINKFLAIYLERFASPTVVGKYPRTWDDNEVTRFSTVLKTIQNKTTLAIPDDAVMEFVQANKDSSDTYIRALNYYNMLIARSILVPDLIGVSGEKTSGGSYSLGSEQFKLLQSSVEKDRVALARKITLRLIRPLVRANYGEYDAEFKFLPFTSDNNTDLLRIWSEAARGKLFKPNEEEINHLRSQLKFPEGPVIIPEPQPNPLLGIDEKQEEPQSEPKAKAKDFKFRRAFTLHEAKVNFDDIQEDMRSNADGIAREIARILNRMAKDLVSQAKDHGIVKDFRPEAIESLEPKFRRELNEALSGHFVTLFREAVDGARKELRLSEKRFVADDIIPEEFEKIIRAEAFKLTGEMSNEIRKRVATNMFDGVKKGLPMQDITDSIFYDLDKYTSAQLRTIVNTKTTEVFNSARMTFFNSDPVAQDIVVGYQYSAILDESTTEVCSFLDQMLFDAKDAQFVAQIQPPGHFNCRSMLIPVTIFENPDFDSPPSLDKLRAMGGSFFGRKEVAK